MFDKDNKFGFIINNNENSNNINSSDIKKYIDDNTVIHPLPVYEISESPSMITYMVNIMDLKTLTTYGAIRDMNSTKYQRYRFVYICDDGKKKTIINTGDDINDTTFRVYHYGTSSTLTFNNKIYSINYTNHSTSTDVVVTESIQKYLGIYNTQEYTPEEDYNPATKKYVDDKIKTDLGDEELTTVNKDVKGAINEVNAQYKDIANLSLTKHTDGKVYIKKQDGTLIGNGIEIGGSDVDLSKISMSMSGQTLKLLNDDTQIATVEIPTAVVTDEQLTNIIQSKIDDGTLGALTIENGSIGAEKTNFITNEHVNILNYAECKEKVGINITTGEEEGTINWGITGYIPVEYGTIYYIYFNTKYETTSLCQYDENKTFLEGSADYIENTINITNSNTKYIRFKASGLSSIVVTKDSSCTEYIPYSQLRLTGFSNDIKQLLNKNTSENFNTLSTNYFNSAKKIVTPDSTTFLIEEPLNYIDVSKLIADKSPASTGINNMIAWNGKYCSNIVELTGDGTYYCYNGTINNIRFYNNEEVDITPDFTVSNPAYHGYVKFEINEGTLTVYGDSASDGIVTAIAENVNVKYARFGTNNNTSPMVTKDEKYTTYYDFKYKILKIDDNYKETFAKYILDNTNIVKDRVNKAINPLYGKTWLSLGDSITQYFKDGNYMDIVKNNLCLGNYKTYALAGALWENGQSDASTTDIETTTSKGTSFGQYNLMKADIDGGIVSPDIITIALGTNCTNVGEFWADESTHTVNTDTTTMCGAMHVILQKILTNYTNENIRIGGIIPPQAKGRSSEINESNKTKLNLIRRIYEFYSIPYLDLEKEGYIIDSNIVNNGTLGDGLHPSTLGNKLYARKITNFIKNL